MFDWINIPGYRIGHADSLDRAFVLAADLHDYDYLMTYESNFFEKWGPRSLETFMQALKGGDDEERLISIWAIGCFQSPDIYPLLRSYLDSPFIRERWSSILCLGSLQDPEILPLLLDSLTEYLPLGKERLLAKMDDQFWVDEHRLFIPHLLRRWDQPSVVLAFQRTLELFFREVHTIPAWEWNTIRSFPDILAYEIGYRGAFDVFTNINLFPLHLHVALVNCAVGHYAHVYSDMDTNTILPIDRILLDKACRMNVSGILQEKLSIEKEQAIDYVGKYFLNKDKINEIGRGH